MGIGGCRMHRYLIFWPFSGGPVFRGRIRVAHGTLGHSIQVRRQRRGGQELLGSRAAVPVLNGAYQVRA